jgi:hypothetical protein
MIQYQLRLPDPMSPGDLIQEMAVNSWYALKKRLKTKPKTDEAYLNYRTEIQKAFSPYVKALSLCGSSNICEDEMKPFQVDSFSELESRIFQFQLPLQMNLFLDLVASSLLRKIYPSLTQDAKNQARSDLRSTFRSTLNQYLCINPWCGKAQMCDYSRPIDPWSESEVSAD